MTETPESSGRVLIESDWNLKTTKGITDSEQALVLIESDWNLKESTTTARTCRSQY